MDFKHSQLLINKGKGMGEINPRIIIIKKKLIGSNMNSTTTKNKKEEKEEEKRFDNPFQE